MELPFKCWEYQPAYIPEGESFFISESSKKLEEPVLFINPFGIRPDLSDSNIDSNQSFEFKEITSVCLSLPIKNPMSDALEFVSGLKNMNINESTGHSLEIGFDGEKAGKLKNFYPYLPLALNW